MTKFGSRKTAVSTSVLAMSPGLGVLVALVVHVDDVITGMLM